MLIFGGDWGSPYPSIVFLVERNGHGNRHSNHCLKDYISSCGGVRNRSYLYGSFGVRLVCFMIWSWSVGYSGVYPRSCNTKYSVLKLATWVMNVAGFSYRKAVSHTHRQAHHGGTNLGNVNNAKTIWRPWVDILESVWFLIQGSMSGWHLWISTSVESHLIWPYLWLT